MAIIKGQTNAKSSGGNSGNDLSPYLIYGIAPTFDDDENVFVYDLDDGDIFIQNIDGEETSISDFVKGQFIYEIDNYGKYLKGIWEFDRIIEGTNKIAVFSYGYIPSTPIIEIDGTQAKNTPNEYSLTLEQYREFIVNDIVKVVFPNDNTLYVYVKAQYEDETAITFSRGEWDSVNSQYIVEKLTLTATLPSTFDLVHTTEALSSGGGGGSKYQHNIIVKPTIANGGLVQLIITNDDNTPYNFASLVSYVKNGNNNERHAWGRADNTNAHLVYALSYFSVNNTDYLRIYYLNTDGTGGSTNPQDSSSWIIEDDVVAV